VYWLEVSMYLEGTATFHIDTILGGFSLSSGVNAECVYKIHGTLNDSNAALPKLT
jgi:hypothetical protein